MEPKASIKNSQIIFPYILFMFLIIFLISKQMFILQKINFKKLVTVFFIMFLDMVFKFQCIDMEPHT